MKKTITSLLPILVLGCALALMGCEEGDPSTQDTGGVTLTVSMSEFPFRVSVNDGDSLFVDNIDVSSVINNPNASSSALMDVRLNTLEVRFTRADGGTRVPAPLVRRLIAMVPTGSKTTFSLTLMTVEQLRQPPLSDLLYENGGFDRETGRTNIKMNVTLKFYGETLGGSAVTTEARELTIEFIP